MAITKTMFILGLAALWYCGSCRPSHCLWPHSCEQCELGWYGDRCDYSCINCDIGGCHRRTGTCHQCSAGYYTTECKKTCPPHCRKSYDGEVYCNRTTGVCLENCQHGWFGDRCENECSDGCLDNACFFYDGSCIKGCISGVSGEKCDHVKCPDNCLSTRHDITVCDRKTRRCMQGCKPGWSGHRCERECGDHCINNACHQLNETCSEGCEYGWAGDLCDVQCPAGCLNATCTRYDGYNCTQGCEQGFSGAHCNRTCRGHRTKRDCSPHQRLTTTTENSAVTFPKQKFKPLFIAIITTVTIVSIGIVLGLVWFLKARRRDHDRSSSTTSPSNESHQAEFSQLMDRDGHASVE